MVDIQSKIADVVARNTKAHPEYLKTRALASVSFAGATAFILWEQIDERRYLSFTDPQYRFSIWLMKPGEVEFTRMHEAHAYESEKSTILISLEQNESGMKGYDALGNEVWSYCSDTVAP